MKVWLIQNIINLFSLMFGKNKLTVLAYHRVSNDNSLVKERAAISVVDFENQVVWLKKYYKVMSLPLAIELLEKNKLPLRAVVLTVDDGYEDVHSNIFPILKKHGLSATIFISTSGIKKGLLWDELIYRYIKEISEIKKNLFFQGRSYDLSNIGQVTEQIINEIKYKNMTERELLINSLKGSINSSQPNLFLTAEQIKSIHSEGFCIGAHTVNHPVFIMEDKETIEQELKESKDILENIIKEKVYFFAFPNGKKNIDFLTEHEKLVRNSGYYAAFSTDRGCANLNNRYSLKRFTPWDKGEVSFALRLALNYFRKY